MAAQQSRRSEYNTMSVAEPRRPQVERILLLGHGQSPTLDFYLRNRLQGQALPWQFRDIRLELPQVEDLLPGTWVVLVRYLNSAWVKALTAHRAALAGVSYLMDDELLDWRAWLGLPWKYQWRLHQHCRAQRSHLQQLVTAYWFSTPALCRQHAPLKPLLVPPESLPEDNNLPPPTRAQRPTLFYHGTSSHRQDMAWLRPVLNAVLRRCPQAEFEAIGGQAVRAVFGDLPRTRVLPTMSWPAYLDHCRQRQGGIGLAPLLDSRFNAARSHTRALDIARCRSAGVFSADGPYGTVIESGVNGVLLPNLADVWVEQLCSLVHNPDRLSALTAQSVALNRHHAGPSLAELLRPPAPSHTG